MSFIRKNCTIVVLVAIIISSFSLSVFANCEMYDGVYLSEVNVDRKEMRGAAPQTDEALLNTSSPTVIHESYVAMGCYECDDPWVSDTSDIRGLDPELVRVYKSFDFDCWSGGETHSAAYYDAIIYS